MLTNPLKYREYMHYGIIADMPGLSQVFEHVNIDDTLEISLLLDKNFKPQYLGVSKNKTGAEYKQ